MDFEVGQCLYYSILDASIFIIITNNNTTDHFSYQNLEDGLKRVKILIKNDQKLHLTFIIQEFHNNHTFESIINNKKIVFLIRSAFLELTPCVIFVM